MEQGPIDHNLKFICESTQPDWIKVSTQIVFDQKEDKQIPYCLVSARKKYPEDQVEILINDFHLIFLKSCNNQIPQFVTLKLSVLSQRDNTFKLVQEFNFEFLWAFKLREEMVIYLYCTENFGS